MEACGQVQAYLAVAQVGDGQQVGGTWLAVRAGERARGGEALERPTEHRAADGGKAPLEKRAALDGHGTTLPISGCVIPDTLSLRGSSVAISGTTSFGVRRPALPSRPC